MAKTQILDWWPNSIFHNAFHRAHRNFSNGGTILEFGVGRGASYCWMAEHMLSRYKQSTLIGFDSYQGLPEETKGVWCPDTHAKGRLKYGKSDVINRLFKVGITMDHPRFNFIDGFYCDTLKNHSENPYIHTVVAKNNLIFVNIDVDIHSSTVEVLEFIAPMLRVGTILYFDDWKDPHHKHDNPWGEHLACEQWLAKHDTIRINTVEVNEVNQRYMEVIAV